MVVDDVHPLTAGPGCAVAAGDSTKVQCNSAGITLLRIDAGDLNDTITKTSPHSSYLWGGTGNDTLDGGLGADLLTATSPTAAPGPTTE